MTLSAIGHSLIQIFQSFGDQIRSVFRPGPAARPPDFFSDFARKVAAFFARFTGSPPEPERGVK